MDLEQTINEILYADLITLHELGEIEAGDITFTPTEFVKKSGLYFEALELIQENILIPAAERKVIDEDTFVEMAQISDVCGNAYMLLWNIAVEPSLLAGEGITEDIRKSSVECVVGVYYTLRWAAGHVLPRMVVETLEQDAAACIALMRIVLTLFEGDQETMKLIRERFDNGGSFSVDMNGHIIYIQ